MHGSHEQKIQETLVNPHLQKAVYTATGRLATSRAAVVAGEVLPEYQELRTQANSIKKHTIENLDYYLEQFEAKATANGAKVIWARNAEDVFTFLVGLAKERGAHNIVKSKSMTTEEIGLNEHLAKHAMEPVETDLGEFIIQLAHDRPYHIIVPAIHMTRNDVADLFTNSLGVERDTVIENQTKTARRVLRERFLAADIGISGANFLLSDSGSIVIVENEGNARLSTTAPKIHVAIAGIEKMIPRAQDLAVFLKLLGRSGTGQQLTSYTSCLSGPRRGDEVDGPDEMYIVLLDNGRTRLLADAEKRQSLYCIRCGACLNHCPVYRKIGGHNYPWVYSGPIGAVISPQYQGVMHDPWLPFASSLCGACSEVCPVKIDLPKVLLDLRKDVNVAVKKSGQNRIERLSFKIWSWVMRHPKIYEMAGLAASLVLPRDSRWVSKLPGLLNQGPARAWLSQRDLPGTSQTFREQWRTRKSKTEGE